MVKKDEEKEYEQMEKHTDSEALARESVEYASLVVLLNSDIGRMVLHHTGTKSVRAFCRDCIEQIDWCGEDGAEEYAEI